MHNYMLTYIHLFNCWFLLILEIDMPSWIIFIYYYYLSWTVEGCFEQILYTRCMSTVLDMDKEAKPHIPSKLVFNGERGNPIGILSLHAIYLYNVWRAVCIAKLQSTIISGWNFIMLHNWFLCESDKLYMLCVG